MRDYTSLAQRRRDSVSQFRKKGQVLYPGCSLTSDRKSLLWKKKEGEGEECCVSFRRGMNVDSLCLPILEIVCCALAQIPEMTKSAIWRKHFGN
ncbi:hypothetical protein CEXT_462331 [Caerostris extrusa]|uniref:Uncharacterized protein n=1 Tax=Caerostris extrusa TaxID=172846 RepID=A0AAV4UMM1_CAEEX|nr:hypothetical protein CEXT_462331 [Caerostris extrusa]